MCGNSGEAFVHRRKQNTDRSTEDSVWKCFSSGERPLHGGVYQKIAPAPGKPISPEENIQNVGRTPAKPPFTGGNKTPTVRRRTATGSGFSSGERPLHGGAFQKIAPAPGKPISPEENIQNVWELRRSLRSPEEMTNGECFLLPSPLCIMEQRDCNHEKRNGDQYESL